MSTFEDFIIKTNESASPEQVFDVLKATLKKMGYDHIIYSAFTMHPSLGLEIKHGIEATYPTEWLEYYNEKQYALKDPVCLQAIINPNPFSWSWMVEHTPITKEQKLIMNEAREFNLIDGIAIPIYGPLGEVAGIGLASETSDIQTDETALSLLRAMTAQFHIAYNKFSVTDDKKEKIYLSEREKEILTWASEGKNDAAIADILNIAYPTVRYHLANAFEKLGAKERTLAVVKAIRLGLISPALIRPESNPTQTK